MSRAISSTAGAARALAKARQAAVADPEFVSLPEAPRAETRALVDYHDPELMDVSDERLVESGWTIVNGALRTFVNSSRLAELAGSDEGLRRLGLIVGGDVTMLQERIAIVSTHMPRVQTDESTLISAFVTAMVEAQGAKGSGWSAGHAARTLHRRGRRDGGPGGDRRDGRRARAVRAATRSSSAASRWPTS